jgi:hypothetical protein
MGFRGAVFGFLIGESLAAPSGIVCAECDPAKPVEPIASRFEMRGDTVYDRRTGLTWMRCSYGQAWTESGGCSGEVKLLDWEGAMDCACPETSLGDFPRRTSWRAL